MRRRRRRALGYGDLPPEMKDAIQDYLRHTNASLRAAVAEYFEDTAATEREWGRIGTWDVGRVTDMSGPAPFSNKCRWFLDARREESVLRRSRLFYRRRHFTPSIGGIGAWDTSSVANMKEMFMRCHHFNANISAWDTSSVRNMMSMFANSRYSNPDISAWDTSSVTTCADIKGRRPLRFEAVDTISTTLPRRASRKGRNNSPQPRTTATRRLWHG
jgi:surface protein